MQPSTTKVVVADSGPLIALGRLDELALLRRVFEQVQVPRAVLAECLARPELADAQRLVRATRIGLLPAIGPLVEQLRANGHRLSDSAVADALSAAGE